MKNNKNNFARAFSLITQLGISMAVPIIGCIFIGIYIDSKLGTNILFLAIFTVLGIGTSFKTLYTMVKSTFKD